MLIISNLQLDQRVAKEMHNRSLRMSVTAISTQPPFSNVTSRCSL